MCEYEIKGQLHRFQDIKSFISDVVKSNEGWSIRWLVLIMKEKKESSEEG